MAAPVQRRSLLGEALLLIADLRLLRVSVLLDGHDQPEDAGRRAAIAARLVFTPTLRTTGRCCSSTASGCR
jgi:hypothetical protein